jgi:hypothetical protein
VPVNPIVRRVTTVMVATVLIHSPLLAQRGNGSDVGGLNVSGSSLVSGLFAPPSLPSVSQSTVAALLSAPAGSAAAVNAQTQFVTAVTTAAADAPSAAVTQALAEAISSLSSTPTAQQVLDAIAAFNAAVDAGGAEFLQSPPAEFRAVRSLLADLIR